MPVMPSFGRLRQEHFTVSLGCTKPRLKKQNLRQQKRKTFPCLPALPRGPAVVYSLQPTAFSRDDEMEVGGCGLVELPNAPPLSDALASSLATPTLRPRPCLGIVIHPWLGGLQPLFDLGPAPRSPPGAERSLTNQRSQAGLRLLKPRPPPLILIASV